MWQHDIILPFAPETPVLLIENVFTRKECEEIIPTEGYAKAMVSDETGALTINPHVRQHAQRLCNSSSLANEIVRRLQPFFGPLRNYEGSRFVGLENLWFYRFRPGDFYRAHSDSCVTLPGVGTGRLTLQLYLTDNYTGGTTGFLQSPFSALVGNSTQIRARAGSVLIYPPHLLRSEEEVTGGIKYLLRAEMMYSDDDDELSST